MDKQALLRRLAGVPVTRWSYKAQDRPDRPHGSDGTGLSPAPSDSVRTTATSQRSMLTASPWPRSRGCTGRTQALEQENRGLRGNVGALRAQLKAQRREARRRPERAFSARSRMSQLLRRAAPRERLPPHLTAPFTAPGHSDALPALARASLRRLRLRAEVGQAWRSCRPPTACALRSRKGWDMTELLHKLAGVHSTAGAWTANGSPSERAASRASRFCAGGCCTGAWDWRSCSSCSTSLQTTAAAAWTCRTGRDAADSTSSTLRVPSG